MTVTRSGRAVTVGAVALGVAGFLLDYPELVLLAAGGVAALAAALAVVARPRPRLSAVRSIRPDEPRAGDTVTVTVTVTNTGPRRSPAMLAVDDVAGVGYRVPVRALAGGARDEVRYDLPTVRRGRLGIGGTEVVRGDPFGLLRSSTLVGGPSVVRVYPRWHDGARPITELGADAERGRSAAVVARGDVAFHSLRDYRPGDAVRLIHWRTSAKRRILTVRQQPVPDEPRQVLVLDTAAVAYPGESFEDAVRVAASLVAAVRDAGLALDLRTASGAAVKLPRTMSTPGDRAAAFDVLCDVEPVTGGPGMAGVLAELGGGIEGTVLGIVTGRLPDVTAAAVARLRRLYPVVYVVQVGRVAPAGHLDGVRHVHVEDSARFVPAWNAGVGGP